MRRSYTILFGPYIIEVQFNDISMKILLHILCTLNILSASEFVTRGVQRDEMQGGFLT